MLIFYVKQELLGVSFTTPIVIIDAQSSDDRFTDIEIKKIVNVNSPDKIKLSTFPKVYSCEYSMQFDHVGIPVGQALKVRFTASLKSPPAALVTAFSPTFLTSSRSMEEMSNRLGTIANPQTRVTYAAFAIKGQSGKEIISRQFIVYAAPLYPDAFGTNTTMVLAGSAIDDILIKSDVACQITKKLPLSVQVDKILAAMNPPKVGIYINAPEMLLPPVSEILLPPMSLNNFLAEICMQNKLIPVNDGGKVIFYTATKQGVNIGLVPRFSFLGSAGFLAWGLGVENYANVKFKSAVFDCKLFGKIIMFNDIKSAFFSGLVKNSLFKMDAYDFWIIRYSIKWNREETISEVTATNNWLMSQFRVDGLLESAVYLAQTEKLK
jgi:hypothetical protein